MILTAILLCAAIAVLFCVDTSEDYIRYKNDFKHWYN